VWRRRARQTFIGGVSPGKDVLGRQDPRPDRGRTTWTTQARTGALRRREAPGTSNWSSSRVGRSSPVQPCARWRPMLRRLTEHGYLNEAVDVYTAEEKDSVLPGVTRGLVAQTVLAGTLQFSVTRPHSATTSTSTPSASIDAPLPHAAALLPTLGAGVATAPHPLQDLVAQF